MSTRKTKEKAPLNFEGALKVFIKSTDTSKAMALVCATLSAQHFAEHGDLSKVQQFYEAMPKNYMRKAAFLAWLVHFFPVKMTGGKFVKDKERAERDGDTTVDANGITVIGAAYRIQDSQEKAFWDFAPEAEIKEFSKADAIALMKALVKRLSGEKSKAKDQSAMDTVHKFEEFVNTLAA